MDFHTIFLVLAGISSNHGLYFHMGQTEKKCFIEEIPDETMVRCTYKTQLYDHDRKGYLPSSPGIGMHVEVSGPEREIVLSKFYASEGRFTFTSMLRENISFAYIQTQLNGT